MLGYLLRYAMRGKQQKENSRNIAVFCAIVVQYQFFI